jgi:anti-anti-sigma factor
MSVPQPLQRLRVDFEEAPPALHVQLSGDIDVATSRHIDMLSCLPLSNVTMILLDLSQVEFCDTSGIHALVNLRDEQLRARRQVWITRLPPRIRYLLEVMGVARHFLQ